MTHSNKAYLNDPLLKKGWTKTSAEPKPARVSPSFIVTGVEIAKLLFTLICLFSSNNIFFAQYVVF